MPIQIILFFSGLISHPDDWLACQRLLNGNIQKKKKKLWIENFIHTVNKFNSNKLPNGTLVALLTGVFLFVNVGSLHVL